VLSGGRRISVKMAGNVMQTLKMKMQALRDEMDKYRDMYEDKCKEVDEERGKRNTLELEVETISRRIRLVEDDHEQTISRLQSTSEKLNDVTRLADENERAKKSLENRQNYGEDRLLELEQAAKESREAANESERKLTEASRKIVMVESELERTEERCETAEHKLKRLEEELTVATAHLKSLEFSEGKLSEREETYESTIRDLANRLKEAENRAADAERSAAKLQRDVDRLEEDIEQSRAQNKALKAEMEACFQDLQSI